MSDRGFLESLEEGLVFRISRFFFLLIVVLLMFTVLGGIGYLFWGYLPTTAPLPSKHTDLTKAEIVKYLATNPVESASSPAASPAAAGDQAEATQKQFGILVDSIHALLPLDTYPWDEVRTTVGEGMDQQSVVTEKGVDNLLREFFEPYNGYEEMTPPARNLVAVLSQFGAKERMKPLKAFVKLYREHAASVKEAEQTAQSAFENASMEKSLARTTGLMIVAAAIAGMAFTAIYLVLLSMQRNIKKMAGEKQ
jgi:hypothetical protein